MSYTTKIFSTLVTAFLLLNFHSLRAQDKISWLSDYTNEMLVGNDTYQYNFTNVEKNDCKLKIEQLLTDKKGATEKSSWVVYLSDIDPSSLNFKAKGKGININMETNRSQEFISYFEEGELDEYTDEIKVTMNDVEMARSFIEAIKEKSANCEVTQETWENWDEAFVWIMNNVDRAIDDDIEWIQKFGPGKRSYLVVLQANSTDEKGEQEEFTYTIDLSDINPQSIDLEISGKSLRVELPVKDGKRYIKVDTPGGASFTDEVEVYVDNIELARQLVKALSYVVNNTTPERPQWDSYEASLGFVRENLGQVTIGDKIYTNSLNFDPSPAGQLDFMIEESESDGTSESVKYSIYPADLKEEVKFEVSRSSITIEMETKNDRDFIRESIDGKVTDYSSSMEFHVSDIDMARDILNAFEYAIGNSEEKITEFTGADEVGKWFSENLRSIESDGDKYEQNIRIVKEKENQLFIEKKLTKADGETTETRFILYPEDISTSKLDIKVSGEHLSVPLATEKTRYIKNYENGEIQDFTGSVEILFLDPLVAKNFMAAITWLKDNSVDEEKADMSLDEAIDFLTGNIQNLDLPGKKYEQKFEVREVENCIMSFTRVETDSKGESDEYIYEFNITDIHPENSKFTTDDDLVVINLETTGNKKLIKPYENGEADDFIDDFEIYADDILLAKKILAAFAALSRGCK